MPAPCPWPRRDGAGVRNRHQEATSRRGPIQHRLDVRSHLARITSRNAAPTNLRAIVQVSSTAGHCKVKSLRLNAVALLICAIVLQGVLAPVVRGWTAGIAALEAELQASFCAHDGAGAPNRPGKPHCPDMPCCLAAQRAGIDSGLAVLVAGPFIPAPRMIVAWTCWGMPSEAHRVRVASSPKKARAPPA